MKYSMECSTDAIAAIKVFEENLGGNTSGQSSLMGTILKFTLTAESPMGGNANKLQAANVVAETTKGVSTVSPISRFVDLTISVVDTTTNVITKVQTFNNTWSILLERIELLRVA